MKALGVFGLAVALLFLGLLDAFRVGSSCFRSCWALEVVKPTVEVDRSSSSVCSSA